MNTQGFDAGLTVCLTPCVCGSDTVCLLLLGVDSEISEVEIHAVVRAPPCQAADLRAHTITADECCGVAAASVGTPYWVNRRAQHAALWNTYPGVAQNRNGYLI